MTRLGTYVPGVTLPAATPPAPSINNGQRAYGPNPSVSLQLREVNMIEHWRHVEKPLWEGVPIIMAILVLTVIFALLYLILR